MYEIIVTTATKRQEDTITNNEQISVSQHQQVLVDYWSMVKTSFTCLLLALSGYILIKMVQTIFWLPGYLQNNQKRLEELAAQYSVDLNKHDEEEPKDNEKESNTADEAEIPVTTGAGDDTKKDK